MGQQDHVPRLPAAPHASRWRLGLLRTVLRCALLSAALGRLAYGQSNLPLGSDASSATRVVSGQIINASTKLPVARALVRMNTELVLSDSEGKFEFRDATSSTVSLSATKPGFYASLDPNSGNGEHRIDLAVQDGPIQLRLYPEAVITGTVIAPNGDPLAHVAVEALRDVNDEGGEHWEMSNQTTTNERGEFRLPVPSGDYSVQIPYMPRISEFPEAVLPLTFPPASSGAGFSVLHVAAGTQEPVELRPELRSIYSVRLHVESAEGSGYPVIEARWNNQGTLRVNAIPTASPAPGTARRTRSGEFTLELPAGDYMLVGKAADNTPSISYGETQVLVADKDVDGVVLRLARQSNIPVTLLLDPASTSENAVPNLQQFGLWARSDAAPGGTALTYYLTAGGRAAATFSVPPGSYQLHAQSSGTWFVQKITAGSTDLLNHNLEVAQGGSGEAIEVTVSNQTGSVQGTVKVDGKAAECAIALIAKAPSITPMLILQSSFDGSFNRSNVPPGDYIAIGFETRPNANLLSPQVQEQFSTWMKTVQVNANETAEVELEAVPASELKP